MDFSRKKGFHAEKARQFLVKTDDSGFPIDFTIETPAAPPGEFPIKSLELDVYFFKF